MVRLHPGEGVIISWEPDHSSQVMTQITSSVAGRRARKEASKSVI
jgi:hypothetical protein